MNYPSIIQYIDAIDAIDAGRDFFLGAPVVPVLCRASDGEPIYSSGNFGVVFKVQIGDEFRALKCFTRQQQGREQAYATMHTKLPQSSYLIEHQFIKEGILVLADDQFRAMPILLMEWIEGQTLGQALIRAAQERNKDLIQDLSKKFDDMAIWLISQDIAHGDLKPENILITKDQELRLVDYDGMYLPSMSGENQREVGTPSYQHPLRAQMPFSPAIDHYSIALLCLTLRCLAQAPELYAMFGNHSGALLFEPAELIAGRSAAFDFIASSGMVSDSLMQAVCGDQGKINGLAEVIIEHVPLNANNLTPFEHNGHWGFHDLSSNRQIAPIYDKVQPFSQGLAAVKIARRWGYINTEGLVVYSFLLDDAWNFSEGLALIRRKNKYGFLNLNGRAAIAARYDFARSFSCGVAAVSLDGLYGYINHKGRWKIKPQYTYAESFRHGVARVEKDGVKMVISIE